VKAGDLVKVKWATPASQRRAEAMGAPVTEPGLVLEISNHGTVVVGWSIQEGLLAYEFLISNLECLNHPCVADNEEN